MSDCLQARFQKKLFDTSIIKIHAMQFCFFGSSQHYASIGKPCDVPNHRTDFTIYETYIKKEITKTNVKVLAARIKDPRFVSHLKQLKILI